MSADWLRLHRRSYAASAVMSLALVVPLTTVLTKALLDRAVAPPLVAAADAGAAVLIVIGVVVYDVLRLRATAYRITGDRVELRTGIMVREHRSIPRDRVRTVDVTASPVRRALGLAVVRLGTGERAGADRAELTLDPVGRAEADRLRRVLLHLEAAGEPPAPIAELSWAWLRFAPLTVWALAGGAALVGVANRALDLLGVDPLDIGADAGLWERLTALPLWLLVPLLLAVNLAAGTAGALLLFAESWWRYRLDREPNGTLRLRRGMLTTRSLTLSERRLRGVELSEPLPLRWGGGARVKAIVAGLSTGGENETERADTLTPPVPLAVARLVAGEVSPGDRPALSSHPRAARARRLRWAAFTVVFLAGAVAVCDWRIAWVPWWAWFVPAVAVPVAALFAADAYRALGHALGPRHLIFRSGSAVRRAIALDRAGVIGWNFRQSVFQRRSGLVTLVAATAAGSGSYSLHDAAENAAVALADGAVPGLLAPFRASAGREEIVTRS
ncbi:PH domain-containing protein [Spongiactinospora sp. TRM90649]|uniref:PH domain-containing protein n=1 Tax=Spongiactinospora sp. TRM90649 TaxID=3031114 RepID=UPI0023F8D896|nr:PH domain-containing protein [Spongiactinospora sp. TRM90649]MDF5758486.1 PH domain-containing protein [Spongiactinospora sp. TRM90649]